MRSCCTGSELPSRLRVRRDLGAAGAGRAARTPVDLGFSENGHHDLPPCPKIRNAHAISIYRSSIHQNSPVKNRTWPSLSNTKEALPSKRAASITLRNPRPLKTAVAILLSSFPKTRNHRRTFHSRTIKSSTLYKLQTLIRRQISHARKHPVCKPVS
jgi:hypothetical protein